MFAWTHDLDENTIAAKGVANGLTPGPKPSGSLVILHI